MAQQVFVWHFYPQRIAGGVATLVVMATSLEEAKNLLQADPGFQLFNDRDRAAVLQMQPHVMEFGVKIFDEYS